MSIQIRLEILTTIFIAGILFVFLGSYRLIIYAFNNLKSKEDIKLVDIDTDELDFDNRIPKKFSKKSETELHKKTIQCGICGEEYPEDTIHEICIACGSPLLTSDKINKLKSKMD